MLREEDKYHNRDPSFDLNFRDNINKLDADKFFSNEFYMSDQYFKSPGQPIIAHTTPGQKSIWPNLGLTGLYMASNTHQCRIAYLKPNLKYSGFII